MTAHKLRAMPGIMRAILLLLTAGLLAQPAPVLANDLIQGFTAPSRGAGRALERGSDNPFDQDALGSARRSGDILPMWDVVRRLGPELSGQVVATDIVQRDGRWLYQFQVLRPDGRLVRVLADAHTGAPVRGGR